MTKCDQHGRCGAEAWQWWGNQEEQGSKAGLAGFPREDAHLADEGAGLLTVHLGDATDALSRAIGLHHRPFGLGDVELHVHARQRGQNVGKEDDAVGLVGSPRLQADLQRHLGDLRSLPEGRILRAEVAVDLRTQCSHRSGVVRSWSPS